MNPSASAAQQPALLTRRIRMLLLAGIVLLGAWLRLPGLFYTQALHFDEAVYISNVLCRPSPGGTFYHPFLSRYLLTVVEGVHCVRALAAGTDHPARDTQAEFASNQTPFLITGRALSMAFGLATIALVYVLGSSLAGTAVGLAAALFIAVAPTNITLSNNLGPWCLATLLTTGVFVCLRRIQLAQTRRELLWLGVVFGLTVSVVYTLSLLALPVLLVLYGIWRARRAAGAATNWLQDAATVFGAALLAHCLTNFTALMRPVLTLHEIFIPEASLFSADSAKVKYLDNLGWHIQSVFDHLGPTWPIGALGLIGLVIAALRLRGVWLAMLLFTVIILFLQPAVVVLMANRYTAPLTPLLAVCAAWLLFSAVPALLGAAVPARARVALPVLLAALSIVPALLTDFAYRRALALTPTRELAVRWIEANIPSGSKVVQSIEYMGPVILDCGRVQMLNNPAYDGRPCYQEQVIVMDPELYNAAFLDLVTKSDAQYLIYNATTPPGTVKRLGRTRVTPAMLRERYTLLSRFVHPGLDDFQDDTTILNPIVEIYRLSRPDSP